MDAVELGIPVRAVVAVGPFIGADVAGAPCLYTVMAQESGTGGVFVLQVDPASGACRRFDAPPGYSGARPSYWSARWRGLYLGASASQGGGHLLRFDPVAARVLDLGEIMPGHAVFPVGMAEAPDGTIYIGGYGECTLTSYHPARREFRQFGRMDGTDHYFYPACGADGTVAGVVRMARPHVVLVDPATGVHQAVGPVADTDRGAGFVNLAHGGDGLLYLHSHAGWWRLQGMTATPVAAPPPGGPPPTLPDGATGQWYEDPASTDRNRALLLTRPGAAPRVLPLDYEAGGSGIYLLRPGPNGQLYGSSALPLHFFRHDPASGRTTDFGVSSVATGQTYSMECLDGKLYACVYTHGILSVYDPARPYTFGRGGAAPAGLAPLPRQRDAVRWLGWSLACGQPEHANPCILGRMDGVACRPRDMVAGPAGKVWVAAVPDYGMWGGTLSWYDPRTDRFGGAHRDVIADCSPIALTYVPDTNRLVVGTCIYGGSGTRPRVERAALAIWDPDRDVAVSRTDLGLHIIGVMDLEYAGDGLAYAIIHVAPEQGRHAELVLFEPATGRIVARAELSAAAGWPLEVTFQRDARYVYGATRESVYRVPLGTVAIDVLWRSAADGPTAGGALLGPRYYFATHERLRALPVR